MRAEAIFHHFDALYQISAMGRGKLDIVDVIMYRFQSLSPTVGLYMIVVTYCIPVSNVTDLKIVE